MNSGPYRSSFLPVISLLCIPVAFAVSEKSAAEMQDNQACGQAPVASKQIDTATRTRVIEGIVEQLTDFYVSPAVAKKMADSVMTRQKRGDYDSVTNGDAFAKMLTENLQAVSHDNHLEVTFNSESQSSSADATAEWDDRTERTNCGFSKVEMLSDNIGYVRLVMFGEAGKCGATAIAAMNFLAGAHAVIFDLRENKGGDPRMIALLSTFLFSDSTHLNDIWFRESGIIEQYWTLPYIPGKRLDKNPVYVLTAKETSGGAEEFSYNLQNLKRATIVGEKTGGNATPVSDHRLDDHFKIAVPFAKPINPISKTNWEGTGVEPDAKVPASDALTVARKLASEKLTAPKR